MNKGTQIEARMDASARGDKFFYTGRPCKRGHQSPRYTSSGNCKECINGQFVKPLTPTQQGIIRRFRFEALLPLEGADVESLNRYLALCMATWEASVGVSPHLNRWQTKLDWCAANGKLLSEYPT